MTWRVTAKVGEILGVAYDKDLEPNWRAWHCHRAATGSIQTEQLTLIFIHAPCSLSPVLPLPSLPVQHQKNKIKNSNKSMLCLKQPTKDNFSLQ